MNACILLVALAMAVTAAGCGGATSSGATGEIDVRVLAGPTCPVETVPPKPECKPHAVDGARIVLDGPAHLTVDVRNGKATVDVPPGVYTVTPKPVPGLMGTAPATTVNVREGTTTPLRIAYDTGIR